MLRKIVSIDEEKCNGCGLCIGGCHEGALKLIDGKAKLTSDVYCDGLGACLPHCPQDAISIIEREAEAFDENAVLSAKSKTEKVPCGCPGIQKTKTAGKESANCKQSNNGNQKINGKESMISEESLCNKQSINGKERINSGGSINDRECVSNNGIESALEQWPCQIRLVSPVAPFLKDAHILIAADCTAFAYANMHKDFMQGRITLIGCPKLDDTDYTEKFSDILMRNNIKSITLARMEVPCCGGLENAIKRAMANTGVIVPWRVVIIGTDGEIIRQ